MRYIFAFPDIGEGITEGKILEWYVKTGQEIKSGQSVVKMETDKVVTDIPSPKDGVVVNLYGKVGEVINVEDPLIELEIEGVDGEAAQEAAAEAAKPAETKAVDEKGFGVVGSIEVAGDSAHLPASEEGRKAVKTAPPVAKKVLATPVARAMARELGLDINRVPGSGPGGRVMKKDIQGYFEMEQQGKAVPAADDLPRVEYEDLSQIRKTIARRMSVSKLTAAHMTVIEEVEVSRLVKLRQEHKEQFVAHGVTLTYMPFILKAVTLALKEHPALNSELDMDNNRMIYKKYYNIGIAVDTEDGLVVPVIRDVDRLTTLALSKQLIEISEKARSRQLTLEDMKDGTFTVTNYGSIGGTFGVPVINYPQAAILGVGRIMRRPVVENDDIVVGHVLPLSMSVDHRIVDGGEAARFIMRVIDYLKDPISLLLMG